MIKRAYLIVALFFLMTNCTTKKNKFEGKGDEPLFGAIDSQEADYKKTVEKAQSQIAIFQQELKLKPETSIASVKIFVPDEKEKGAFIWLINPVFNLDSCVAEIVEIPHEFADLKPGDKLKFGKKDIQDWYILDSEGRMQGGYSLRYMRQRLSAKDQAEFDKYVGVKIYL